jgi:CheY-like chemotaxis protein
VRILYVQDSLCDADLTQRHLRKAAPHFELDIVSSRSEAIARLQQFEARTVLMSTQPDVTSRGMLLTFTSMS